MRPAFARLFIDCIVEAAYQRILYIDGNTQIAGNIDPLIDVSLPRNTFCAAFDPASLAITYDNRPFPQLFAYFKSIGLSASQISRYINAGVLLLDRTSWAEVCTDSLKLLNPTTQRLRFLDQDLMNLAADGRCLTMSFKWNFPSFLMSYGFEDVIEPRIYHFMGNPRPWQGAFQPWGRKWHRTYTDLVEKYPDLQPYLKTLPTSKYLKFHAQHYYKKLTEGRVWRRPEIRDKIIEIEKNAFI
jgi:lipopolysaccharide biosynthesis glycosyltransferase